MKVLLVCKLNKARSVFGAAILKSIYPFLGVYSAGIEAVENSPVPNQVLEIAKKWELVGFKSFSQSIRHFEKDFKNFNLIITADRETHTEMRKRGYEFESVSLEEFVLDPSFCPQDPIGMSQREMEIELAKVAHSVIRAIDGKINSSRIHPVKCFIPISQDDSELAWSLALFEHVNLGGFLIDADFRAPFCIDKKLEFRMKTFEIQELKSIDSIRFQRGEILCPIREYSNPESILVSSVWNSFINELSNRAPVIMLTAPRFVNRREFPDAWLASSLATSISTVGA